ncbi:RNA-binding protein 4.1-like isoform X3 [Rhinatrema bivittatum]|uniref:RNA-binding protein 4.1-like isoform X3 n=1 Tax=Rhinatrema bivittatum TaxID=194408 RepID=UPI00112B1C6F|nr:RNA-binding protein 4.1-like isoform X3 [Rhinatrema bivittatum]
MVKIFVGGVSPAVTGEELKKLFEKFGQVNECDILKNYAFVHMEKEDEAHRAISELHKHEFHGAHLTVEYATSKIRNATKIYVGNVASSATTAQLKELFERFGKVVECDIVKNYAFVHMAKEREAMDAILHLNDTPLEDQKIFVTLSKSNNSMKGIGKGGSVAAPPPHPSYLFHRTRLPPPPPHFPHYPARSWYDRDYYERIVRRGTDAHFDHCDGSHHTSVEKMHGGCQCPGTLYNGGSSAGLVPVLTSPAGFIFCKLMSASVYETSYMTNQSMHNLLCACAAGTLLNLLI